MANLSPKDSSGRHFPYPSTSVSTAPSTTPALTAPSFSNFQFMEIGRQPALLQRISAPGPDARPYQDLDRSPSLSPDPASEFLPSEMSLETLNPGQPSLQARLSMLESPNDEANGMPINLPKAKKIDMPDQPNAITAPIQNLNPMGGNIDGPVAQRLRSITPNFSIGEHKVDHPHDRSPIPFSNQTNTALRDNTAMSRVSSTLQPSSNFEPTLPSLSPSTNIAPIHNAASLTYEPSLACLRALQMRISSAISNFKPVSTTNALQVAQSAKDRCTEAISSARHAHEHAQRAMASAQLSIDAARECLTVAESVQTRTDEVMAAVEGLASAQEISKLNDTLEALQDNSHLLDQWVRDKEVQDAKYQKEEAERRNQDDASQIHGAHANNIVLPSIIAQINRPQPSAIGVDNPVSSSCPPRAEHEDDPATRAWKQECEEREERKRQAEAEFQKLREVEEVEEQKRKKAQAELDARADELAQRRAERIEAEKQENARQKREAKEAELKQKEVKRTQEEATRRASEKRALEAAKEEQERARLQKEKECQLRAEQEHRRLEKEKTDALEQQRLVQLKRQEISDQKQRASTEEAKRILEERAAKQASQAHRSLTAPTAASSLPLACAPQAVYDCGNIVSKKTLLTSSPAKIQTVVSDKSPFPPPATTPTLGVDDRSQICNNPSSEMSLHHHEEGAVTSVGPGLINIDENRINETLHPFPLPRRQNGWVVPSKTARNQSSPASENTQETMNPLFSPPRPRANIILADISVDSQGSDIGNLPLLPRSQAPPISPEAQKANLRRLMDDNGIPKRPTFKQDPDEGKPVVKLQQRLAAPVPHYSVPKSASRDKNGLKSPIKVGPPRKKPKTESLEDVPLLSLPSPTHSTATFAQATVSSADKSKAKLPTFKRYDRAAIADPFVPPQPPNLTTASANESISTALPTVGQGEPSVANSPVNILSTSLPRRPELPSATTAPQPSIPEINSRISIHFDEDSRMGPDAATGGWYQPSLIDMPDHRQRSEVRAPRPMIDHYSPPPPLSNNRGPPQRSRSRVDHYSPSRRTPEPLPASSTFSSYPRKSSAQSRGPASANNSRGSSPDPARRNNRPLPSEIVPLIGQKRVRDPQDVGGPPHRRLRYEDQPLPHDYNPGSRYSGMNPYQDEWSHTAEYGRSPSPVSRITPLSRRIEPEPDIRPPVSGHRAGYGSVQRYDQPNQRRQTNYPRPLAHGSDHPHQNGNPQKQNYPNYDSPPPLLERFTDSTSLSVPPPDAGYFPSIRGSLARAPKPNLRASAQPLEHRIASKGSLINRLEGM